MRIAVYDFKDALYGHVTQAKAQNPLGQALIFCRVLKASGVARHSLGSCDPIDLFSVQPIDKDLLIDC